jgi:hypothetical protein
MAVQTQFVFIVLAIWATKTSIFYQKLMILSIFAY